MTTHLDMDGVWHTWADGWRQRVEARTACDVTITEEPFNVSADLARVDCRKCRGSEFFQAILATRMRQARRKRRKV